MSNFQPLEVVGRGSETQLQVSENLNKLTQQDKGSYCEIFIPISALFSYGSLVSSSNILVHRAGSNYQKSSCRRK